MRISDKRLLKEFRGEGACESCGKWCARREPHHIFTTGMGGGKRLDIRINLVALGVWTICLCHRMHHDGHAPTLKDFFNIVAKREGMCPDAVEAELRRLQNAPKGPGKTRRKPAHDKRKSEARLANGGVRAREIGEDVDAHEGVWREL